MTKSNYKNLDIQKEQNYSAFVRGDTILTLSLHSRFAKLVQWFTRDKGEAPTKVNHTAIYIGQGKVIEAAGFKISIASLKKYFKGHHHVYHGRNQQFNGIARNAIVAEAMVYKGRVYDYLQIGGFALYKLTGRTFFKKYLQIPWLEVCSTFWAEVHDKIGYRINGNKVAPDDIYDYLNAHPNEWSLTQLI